MAVLDFSIKPNYTAADFTVVVTGDCPLWLKLCILKEFPSGKSENKGFDEKFIKAYF